MRLASYAIKALPCDANSLQGLSAKLISSHHENNYSGAVKRLNTIRGQLAELNWEQTPNFVINGLKREELIAANSAYFHELYFSCLGGDGVLFLGGLSVGIVRDFGSIEAWKNEFIALGKAMGGGSGWALLSWSSHENRLVNQWAADHTHLQAGCIPLLALDMYEHAYHMDFGANAGAYVNAFMQNINWTHVNEAYAHAVATGTQHLAVSCKQALESACTIVDVRRAGAYQNAKAQIAGADWRDPEQVYAWAQELPRDKPVYVYCVFGHEVGQSTAAILAASGLDAKYIDGGFVAWQEEKLPEQAKGA